MAFQFNPPPGWPTPPAGWSPPEGWSPEASWPTPPDGWQFWVEEAEAPAAPVSFETPAAAAPFATAPSLPTPEPGNDPTQQFATQQFGGQPFAAQEPTQQFPAQPFLGEQAPTQQFPNQQFGGQQFPPAQSSAAGYSAAPAPYSAEPSALPYATGSAPSFSPGGYAPQGPGGFGPSGPGGPDAKKPMSKGLLFGIIGGGVVVLGAGIFFLIQALGGGDNSADPTPSPSSSVASPTDDPTTADPTDDPTDDPTTADPTDDPTTPDPTTAPPASGDAPEGSQVIAPGGSFDAVDYNGTVAARVTVQEVQWDPTCASNTFQPDGRYVAVKFEVTATDAADPSTGFMLQGFNWKSFGPAGEDPDFSFVGGLFCTVEGELTSSVLPNTTESGWLVWDVKSDAQWLVYQELFSTDPGFAIALN